MATTPTPDDPYERLAAAAADAGRATGRLEGAIAAHTIIRAESADGTCPDHVVGRVLDAAQRARAAAARLDRELGAVLD